MTATATTMTPERAAEFRAAYDAEARKLARLPRRSVPAGDLCGHYSKDELIRRAMDLGGYTIDRYNEAGHVIHHAGEIWPGCRYCTGSGS